MKPGDLSRHFIEKAEQSPFQKAVQRDLELSHIIDGLENAGRADIGSALLRSTQQKSEEKQRSRQLEAMLQLLRYRDQLLEQLEKLQQQIDELLELRDRISRQLEAMSNCLSQYYDNGIFELDHPMVRSAIHQWEQRNNSTWDPSAPEAKLIFIQIMNEHQEQYDELSSRVDTKRREQDVIWEELDTINTVLEDHSITRQEAEEIRVYRKAGENNPSLSSYKSSSDTSPSSVPGVINLSTLP